MRRLSTLVLISAFAAAQETAVPRSDAPTAIDPEPAAAVYDPLRGMDANGRIPKVALPADVPHPERWRYIPEGRIKPGNVVERFFVTTFISPIIYHEQDIGTGGGIALSDIDFRGQHRREFTAVSASRSSEGQENYAMVWKRALHHRHLPGGGVIVEERSFLRAQVGYERARTRRFFGFGPDSDEDDETSYTDEVGWALAQVSNAMPVPGGDWVWSAGARGEHHNLARGRISDRPTTGDAYPEEFAAGDSNDALWLSAGLRYDTRDSQHQPYAGVRVSYVAEVCVAQDNDEVGAIHEARANVAFRVPPFAHDGGDAGEENPPTDTIALDIFVQSAQGELPFYALPSLGGPDSLRGYIANRFVDRAAWHATAEYRTWVIPRGFALTDAIRMERFGLALFYELGTVAPRVAELDDARIHDSYGVGLRMAFERTAVFRIDVGFSDEDLGVTAKFGMPF